MTGIITFDIQERSGYDVPKKAIEQLEVELEKVAERFYERIQVENPAYDSNEHERCDEEGEEYEVEEFLDLESYNADFTLAEHGYHLAIMKKP